MDKSKNNLVVLQVAPLQYSISDRLKQGGTERVIYLLTKELSKLGVSSIVACCEDSHIPGTECVTFGRPLSETCGNLIATYQTCRQEYERYFGSVIDYAFKNKVLILHDHTGWLLLSNAYERKREQISFPILTTIAPCSPHEKKAEIYGERKKEGGVYFCL